MTSPLITVLVPIYNVEKYVAKCMDLLLAQTFEDFEVYAVSDGSPDKSASIVKKYSEKDSRIKLIVKPNGGYGSVLQYGVENIKSKYFIVCDPDDWLREDALERLYNFSEKNNLDIAVADRYNVYENSEGNEIKYVKTFRERKDIIPKHVYTDRNVIQEFSFALPSPHAKLYKTEIAKNIKFPKHVSYTDFVLYMMSLANAKKVAYYDDALAYYLIERPGNTKTDRRPQIVTDYLIGWNSVLKQLEELNTKNFSVLLYELLQQLLYIMSEYRKTTDLYFSDDRWKEIMDAFQKIRKYSFLIETYKPNTIKEQIKIKLLMNRFCTERVAKFLVMNQR